jgi:hypothetical protein
MQAHVGEYTVDTIRAALGDLAMTSTAARSMTAASSLFMEHLLSAAAAEAERQGSRDVTPEHLKRVAPWVFLNFR